MKKISHFMLKEHTNKLYKREAISSISLTKDVADKINELVDAYNNLYEGWTAKEQEQDGRINKGVVFMKDNLINSLHDLMKLLYDQGYLHSIIQDAYAPLLKTIVIPEMFGAVGDGLTDDTTAFKLAFDFCKKHNLILTSNGRTYLLSGNIEIPDIVIDFNYGTIKGYNNVIKLNNTVFKNVRLHGYTLATTGSDLIIDSIFFDAWKGTALLLDTGTYTHHVKNLYFSQPDTEKDFSGNVGIVFNCSDTVVDGLEGHGFKTAIIVKGQNNGLINAQPWIRHHSNYSGSVCIQLEGTNFFVSNSILDTWEKVFVGSMDFLKCHLHNVSYIHNTEMCDHEHVTIFTKCSLFTGNLILKLSDFETKGCTCEIGGFSHVNVEIIDGALTFPIMLNKAAISNGMPAIDNGEYFIFDNSFIKVNEGKFIAHLTVSVQGTTAGGNIEIDISKIPNLNSIDVRGKALAVCIVNGETAPAWLYYQVNAAKRLVITMPANVTGWWEFTINDVIDAPF